MEKNFNLEIISPEKIILSGDGNKSSGIKGNQSFTLIFNDENFNSTLYFYCTSHSSMIAQFNILSESESLPPKFMAKETLC